MKITLSNKQQKVVDYEGNHLLVLAGAGSGKTRVLTERVRHRISLLKKGQKLLVITFSNKAANELLDRLKMNIDNELLSRSAFVGTIHKFCLDIVLTRGHSISLPNDLQICESYNDRLAIFKEALKGNPSFINKYLNSSVEKENEKKINEIYERLSSAKRNLKNPNDYQNDQSVRNLYEDYDALLLSQGMIDFDDILRYAFKILVENENILNLYRNIYREIYVDESQDLNKAQYEIIKILVQDDTKTTFVGDPNQSIYGFNGSSSSFMKRYYIDDFHPESITLDENFRSSKEVLLAAKKIEPTFDVFGVLPFNGEFSIEKFDNEDFEADSVLSKIRELIEKGHPDIENIKAKPENIAILARNRFIFGPIEDKLKSNKIDYSLKISSSGGMKSESNFIQIFELGLKLLVNSKNRVALEEINSLVHESFSSYNLLRDFFRKSNNIVLQTIENAWEKINTTEDIRFDMALNLLSEIESLVDDIDEKLMIHNDIKDWKFTWQKFVSNTQKGNRKLADLTRSVSMGELKNEDQKGIVLSTVHMSKGLEFDAVFIIGLNDGVFPDYRAVRQQDLNGDSSQIEEEKHNMFVAITRSKRLCYLSYPVKKSTPWGVRYQKPSRFITDLE
jgi:DNA helicase-2/ATP-dependent DNA helicase PcrA